MLVPASTDKVAYEKYKASKLESEAHDTEEKKQVSTALDQVTRTSTPPREISKSKGRGK